MNSQLYVLFGNNCIIISVWLKEIINQLDIMEIKMVVTRLIFENVPNTFKFVNWYQYFLVFKLNRIIWRLPSLSELTTYWISVGLTHLGSEASIYSYTHNQVETSLRNKIQLKKWLSNKKVSFLCRYSSWACFFPIKI